MTSAGSRKSLFKSPRDDADHAGMPAITRDDDHRTISLPQRHCFGFGLYLGLNGPAFLIQAIELDGNLGSFCRIFGSQQSHA